MQITTTRRELIGGAAAALASLQTAGAATTPATHSEDLKLGVASYSFRKFSRADAIKGIKALNIQYVNIKDFHLALKSTPEEIAAARKDFEDAGIKILGVGNVFFCQARRIRNEAQFRAMPSNWGDRHRHGSHHGDAAVH